MTYHDTDAFALGSYVRFQQFAEEGILVDLHSETIFSLNATGAFVLTLIAEGQATFASIRNAALAEFDVSLNQLDSDINALLDELISMKLIHSIR